MNQKSILTVALIFSVVVWSGCGGAPDLPSSAPGLAGNWLVEGNAAGCWVFDETGDPVSYSPSAGSSGMGGVDMLYFDGQTRTVEIEGQGSVDYSAGGHANQDGTQVTIEVSMTMSMVIQLGTMTISIEGTVDGATLEGQATMAASALGTEQEPTTGDFTGTLGGC